MRLLVLKLCVCPALGDTMNSLQMWKYQLTLLSVLKSFSCSISLPTFDIFVQHVGDRV